MRSFNSLILFLRSLPQEDTLSSKSVVFLEKKRTKEWSKIDMDNDTHRSTAISSVDLPQSLQSIYRNLSSRSTATTSVDLPQSLQSIYRNLSGRSTAVSPVDLPKAYNSMPFWDSRRPIPQSR